MEYLNQMLWQSRYGVASIRLVLFCVGPPPIPKILEEESERYIF